MLRLSDTHALVTINGESRVVRIPSHREVAALRRAALRTEIAARRLSHALVGVGRAAQRATYSPGERHIDNVARDVLVRRQDARTATVRLIAAQAVGEALDDARRAR